MPSTYAIVQAIIPWTTYAVLVLYLWLGAAFLVAEYRARHAPEQPRPRRGLVFGAVWVVFGILAPFDPSLMSTVYDWGSIPRVTAVIAPISFFAIVLGDGGWALWGGPLWGRPTAPTPTWGRPHPHNALLFRPPGAPLPEGSRRRREAIGIWLAVLALIGVTLASRALRPCGGLERALGLSGCERTFDAGAPPAALALSADGAVVAGGTWEAIGIWGAADGRRLGGIPKSTLRAIALSPDGQLLAAASYRGPIHILRADGSTVRELPTADEAYGLAFSPDGQLLAAVDGTTVAVWRAADWAPLWSRPVADGGLTGVAFSPDGRTLATGGHRTGLQLWGAEGGAPLRSIPTGASTAIAFSPDGALVAVGGEGPGLGLWRVADGQALWRYPGVSGDGPALGVAFSPDGQSVLSLSNQDGSQGQLTALRASDGGVAETIHFPGAAESLAAQPAGGQVAVGLRDDHVTLWRLPGR